MFGITANAQRVNIEDNLQDGLMENYHLVSTMFMHLEDYLEN